MKAWLKAHRGGFTSARPQGWAPTRQLPDPNAMDTSTGQMRGCITGSEEMDPSTMPQGGYIPCGGFLQRGRGGARQRDLRKVECYTCHKKGHLSRNCPQHTWNKTNNYQNWMPCPSQGQDVVR